MSIEDLRLKLSRQDEMNNLRLANWGEWGKGGIPNFEPATWTEIWRGYITDDRHFKTIIEQDAQHIEHVITTMDLICRDNTDTYATGITKYGTVWAYVLKLRFKECPRPVPAMAELVRQNLKVQKE